MHRAVRALLDGRTFSPTKKEDARFKPVASYEHHGDGPIEDPHAAAKLSIARWTGNLLERTYPGHAWHVEVEIGRNGMGGLIKLRLNGIMPGNRWYNVQLADTLCDPGGKRTVLKGAGELLERYGLHRGNFDLDNWRVALNQMPVADRITGRGHLAPLID